MSARRTLPRTPSNLGSRAGQAASTVTLRPREAPASVHDVLGSSGHALNQESLAEFSQRFGWDFSSVRVHDDAPAAASARAVGARAYTVGKDVVFGRDEYEPHSSAGRRLLAHELAHVVQQRAAPPPGRLLIGPEDSPGEHAAHGAAEAAMYGRPFTAQPAGAPVLQRQPYPHHPPRLLDQELAPLDPALIALMARVDGSRFIRLPLPEVRSRVPRRAAPERGRAAPATPAPSHTEPHAHTESHAGARLEAVVTPGVAVHGELIRGPRPPGPGPEPEPSPVSAGGGFGVAIRYTDWFPAQTGGEGDDVRLALLGEPYVEVAVELAGSATHYDLEAGLTALRLQLIREVLSLGIPFHVGLGFGEDGTSASLSIGFDIAVQVTGELALHGSVDLEGDSRGDAELSGQLFAEYHFDLEHVRPPQGQRRR